VFANSRRIFIFSDLINTTNINDENGVGKLFLMIKIRPEFMGSLVHSLIKVQWTYNNSQ
jgi:hypothetical protein